MVRFEKDTTGRVSEEALLGQNLDPGSPRRFTRLHLLGAKGLRALRADVVQEKAGGYRWTCLMARRQGQGEDLQTAFVALMEPYLGEPFITARRTIDVPGNDADALRAVAVEVKTKNGHTDLLFADGHPEKIRQAGPCKFSGKYAYLSTDADGLRHAAMSGATLLESPELRLTAAARENVRKVVSVDHAARRLQVDGPWPAGGAGRIMEIGSPGRWTSYTLAGAEPAERGSRLAVTRGSTFLRAPLLRIEEGKRVITGANLPLGAVPGWDKNWVLSNDAQTRFWRADAVSGSEFHLKAGTISERDLGPEKVVRICEYGPGDTARQNTFVSLRRVGKDVCELTGDVALTLSLKGKAMETSADRRTWTPSAGKAGGGWCEAAIDPTGPQGGPVYVRVTP
jgi:hypothetical protein